MTTVEEHRTLRADAQRNLERILEVAGQEFAARGSEASVADIAGLAGVGTATIFRRFPTKDALVAAVVERRMAELVAIVGEALSQPGPGRAFRAVMRAVAEYNVHDRCFCESTATDVFSEPNVAALAEEFTRGMETLLERAQAAGEIRKDVTAVDALVLVFAVAQSARTVEVAAPDAWRRYLDIVLDGLRPEGAHRLSRRAPTLAEFEHAKHASKPIA